MLLLALAEGASALADAGAETYSGVLEDGNGAKQDAGEEGNEKREKQDWRINADFTDARKPCGSDGRKNAQRGIGEAQTNSAAEQSEKDAFEQKIGSDARAAGTQRATDGELLTAAFDADEQQIGDIGAGDQKDHADRTHEDPEHTAYVTDNIVLEGTNVGADVRIFEELDAEAGRRRKRTHNDGEHTSNVGIYLLDSDARLEPGETLIAEVAKMGFVTVKLKRDDDTGIFPVQEVKSLRQDADDLPGFAVHDDVAPDHGGVAAKFAAPIAVGEHGGFRSAGRIILFGEGAAEQERDAEERESAVSDSQGRNLFGLGHTGHAHGVARVKTDVLESAVLFAEDGVVGGGQLEFFELDARGSKPDTYHFIGFGIGQGLEENAFEDAEDNRVAAYAGGQCDEGDSSEQGGAAEPS